MKNALAALVLAWGISSGACLAQNPDSMTAAEVRRVDKAQNRVTLRHEPIKNLDMPAMTMVFQVKDPALLEQVKIGDKVNFSAEKVAGAYFVTRLDPMK